MVLRAGTCSRLCVRNHSVRELAITDTRVRHPRYADVVIAGSGVVLAAMSHVIVHCHDAWHVRAPGIQPQCKVYDTAHPAHSTLS